MSPMDNANPVRLAINMVAQAIYRAATIATDGHTKWDNKSGHSFVYIVLIFTRCQHFGNRHSPKKYEN